MTATCPAFSGDVTSRLDLLLATLDCHIRVGVDGAYGRLFGAGSAFQPVLTACLTLFLAFFAFRLLSGRSRISLSGLLPRIILLGVILTLITSWSAYHTLFYRVLTDGPDELVSLLLGKGENAITFSTLLQQSFDRMLSVAASLGNESVSPYTGNLLSTGTLLWIDALVLMLTTLGALIIAKLALGLLLALGPLFILLALFAGTRGLFTGWLKLSFVFALMPLVVTLLGRMMLEAISPLMSSLNTMGMFSVTGTVSPVILLTIATFIYVILLYVVLRSAHSLTSAWHFPFSSKDRQETPAGTAADVPFSPSAATRPEPGNVQSASHQVAAPAAASRGIDTLIAGLSANLPAPVTEISSRTVDQPAPALGNLSASAAVAPGLLRSTISGRASDRAQQTRTSAPRATRKTSPRISRK
ncbi:type IV secretion system protein [Emcibacter nanhaiensis]|uniref:Type IV secretion system protein n=1 Tax=Emcibacter nanhaiensis TaxID=1505037 RepID=A0A501PJN4_9PROT|nr:type IV secretion system protein [Emcibacter nanhaiensis]TPD60221.1 hypothetical protein FIV46_09215 [Emcibacter nanhaiensis]